MDIRDGNLDDIIEKYSKCWACESTPSHDITRITEEKTGNIFISNLEASRCKDLLLKYDINAIINVSAIKYKPISKYYLEHKIYDDVSQILEDGFEKIFDFMQTHLNNKLNVLVHCQAGISRSVSYVCYYLMRSKKISFDKAFEIVSAQRKIANPNVAFKQELRNLDFDDEFDNKSTDTEDESIPYAQKCGRCNKYLLQDQETIQDPKHKNWYSHKSCVESYLQNKR